MSDIEKVFAEVGAHIGGFLLSAPLALRIPTDGAPVDVDAAVRLGAMLGAEIGRLLGQAVDERSEPPVP